MDNEKLNILGLLIENRDSEYSIRQISRLRKINYKTAYENVKKLEGEGIIRLDRKGNISLCSFNGKFNHSVYLVEYERREALLKNKNFRIIHNRLGRINAQFILLLFGSHAKKTQSKQSDIDLLLITNEPERVKNELELLPFDIHMTHTTYMDFSAMLRTREQTVVSEAVKKNVILFGIEDYYRLMENAG